MMEIEATYKVENKESFEDKVLPYIFGEGIFYKIKQDSKRNEDNQKIIIKANNLSQLITALTGMLRYSPGAILKGIEVLNVSEVKSKKGNLPEKILLGMILKPSLSYNRDIFKNLIDSAVKNNIDFIKDDDASGYSFEELKEIEKLIQNVPYFKKIVKSSSDLDEYIMVVPWVNGWSLIEDVNKKSCVLSHCASISPQISWYPHIIFCRLAGASLVIVPDENFDKTFNLNLALEAATKKIDNIETVRLIIGGGITPKRIKEILKNIDKEFYQYIGFVVGSWLLSDPKNLDEKFIELKESINPIQ